MRELFHSLPIQPVYRQGSPNELINIGKISIQLPPRNGELPSEKVANVSLKFLPQPRLTIEVSRVSEVPVPFFLNFDDSPVKITFTKTGLSFDMHRFESAQGDAFQPIRDPIQIHPDTSEIKKARFHLFNWPDFNGPQDCILRTGSPPLEGREVLGRVVLNAGEWKVSIAATDQTRDAIKSLNKIGGYGITHVGTIERDNETMFSTEELDRLLVRLRYFFEFALGAERSPSLVVGEDMSGGRVFEQLGLGFVGDGSWRGSSSWFDSHHSNLLVEVLPGFWSLCDRAVWWKTLKEAIYWYKTANRGGSGLGVDSALLFSQAALELLAWTYCVLDRKMVSAGAFKPRGLSAADKLRLLVSSLGIPLQIPPHLTSLHSKQGRKWEDSMDVITDIRNGLVHPDSDRNLPDGSYYDAWRLSMWYLDLILLKLCGHNGKYANRLALQRNVGTVEAVPWAA